MVPSANRSSAKGVSGAAEPNRDRGNGGHHRGHHSGLLERQHAVGFDVESDVDIELADGGLVAIDNAARVL